MKTNSVAKIIFFPQNLIKKRIYHPESTSNRNHLANILHFRTKKKNKILKIPTQITNQTFMTMIILLTPEDTPIIDTNCAHNQEKTIDFSLVKRIYFHFLKNPAEIQKERKIKRKKKSLKLNVKLNEKIFHK